MSMVILKIINQIKILNQFVLTEIICIGRDHLYGKIKLFEIDNDNEKQSTGCDLNIKQPNRIELLTNNNIKYEKLNEEYNLALIRTEIELKYKNRNRIGFIE